VLHHFDEFRSHGIAGVTNENLVRPTRGHLIVILLAVAEVL